MEIEALSKTLGDMLTAHNLSVTTAESCTGGGISAAITDIAGSSAYFNRGFVTYSNQAKQDLIQVSPSSLEQNGAVSEQVAEEMSLGALSAANANLAIAVTGVAGPGGGSVEKPVGTVFIGLAFRKTVSENAETTVQVSRFQFSGNRSKIREETIKSSIINAISLISEKI